MVLFFTNMFKSNTKFSLVLSGGGALGISQLGVISQLEDKKIIPSEIIGTSIGGIIGACLAIGLKEKDIFSLFQQFSHLTNWMKFSLNGNSIIINDKIKKIFNSIFGNKKMKDTIIPLKIITTDFFTGHKKVFSSTDDNYISDILLATMAIPGVFQEQYINDNILVDGFLTENLGILEASYSHIFAIDVLGENSFYHNFNSPSFFKTLNVLFMFEKSMRLLILNQTKKNLKLLTSDKNLILIDIHTKDFKTFQFHKYRELREIGLNTII